MQEELRTARDFVLAARSAVRIADKRAAIAACDAACDAACAILHRISQQQSAPAEARVQGVLLVARLAALLDEGLARAPLRVEHLALAGVLCARAERGRWQHLGGRGRDRRGQGRDGRVGGNGVPQHESSFFGLHFATACSSEASPSTRRTKAWANRIL